MVIDPNHIKQSHLTSGNNETRKSRQVTTHESDSGTNVTKTQPSTTGEKVSLSVTGKSLAQMESNLAGIPDVDSAKVRALKSAIENGSYRIDETTIADRILAQDDLLG